MWQGRCMTIKDKITLLCAQALPIIMYTASVLYVPQNVLEQIEKAFFKFIWPKGKQHVKKWEYGSLFRAQRKVG